METATLPRTFFDFADMLRTYATGGYPYTPAVGLIAGLAQAIEMLEDEGLAKVYARHARIAEGVRRAVAAWGMTPCAAPPDLYSDTVTAVVVPEGCNGTDLVKLAARKLWHGLRRGAGRGGGQGVPHRPSGQPDRTDDAVGPCDRRDVHGRSGLAGAAGVGRGGGAGLLRGTAPRAAKAAA